MKYWSVVFLVLVFCGSIVGLVNVLNDGLPYVVELDFYDILAMTAVDILIYFAIFDVTKKFYVRA